MLTMNQVVLHHIRASGPCDTDSIVRYLDEQCIDPRWTILSDPAHWDCSPALLKARMKAGKRRAVRAAMDELVVSSQASVYSHDPATCWW
jgi:hypothetical protein